MARLAEHNRRRWSRPEEHQKLSDQNRREWSKPRKRARRIASIKKVNGSIEKREFYSRLRTHQWANDPEYRRKTTEAIQYAKGTPEARALFSQLLRERWNDPIMRAKYSAGIGRYTRSPEARERQRNVMLKRWREDADFRALVAATMDIYWNTPGVREWHSVRLSKLWADPVWRTRQLQKISVANNAPERIKRGISRSAVEGATNMMSAVDAVIPRGLPDFMRADLASDITLALLEGELKFENLESEARSYLTAHRKMFPDKWGPVSIDETIPGTDGLTIADTLSNDSVHF